MRKPEFTPGPWRVGGGTTVVWGACDPDDLSNYGMGYPVTDCRITPISNSGWCQGPEYEEGYANAHLIAAAPELYEALYRLSVDCKIAGLQEQAGFDCWLSMADKALAKARGENQPSGGDRHG